MSRNILPPLAAAVALGLAVLGVYAITTAYRPAHVAGEWDDGYRETRLDDRRWRVVFRGNILTSREAVESALLYRSAELTRVEGYDWFLAVNRDTAAHEPAVRDALGGWGRAWSPHWRGAYGGARRSREPTRSGRAFEVPKVTVHQAIAEIVMGHGAKPEDPRAYDAASVIDALQAQIRPGKE